MPGKSWVSMDNGKSSSSSSGFGTGGIFTDPSTLIAVIGRSPGTGLHALGPAVVNGSRLQQYSVHLGPAGIKKAIGSDTLPGNLRTEISMVHYNKLDYVVGVNGTNHVAQIRTTGAYSAAGEHFTVTGTMDMSDFGTPVTVRPLRPARSCRTNGSRRSPVRIRAPRPPEHFDPPGCNGSSDSRQRVRRVASQPSSEANGIASGGAVSVTGCPIDSTSLPRWPCCSPPCTRRGAGSSSPSRRGLPAQCRWRETRRAP